MDAAAPDGPMDGLTLRLDRAKGADHSPTTGPWKTLRVSHSCLENAARFPQRQQARRRRKEETDRIRKGTRECYPCSRSKVSPMCPAVQRRSPPPPPPHTHTRRSRPICTT